jgi:hypothetical protein
VRFEKRLFQILKENRNRPQPAKQVTVQKKLDGTISIHWNGKPVNNNHQRWWLEEKAPKRGLKHLPIFAGLRLAYTSCQDLFQLRFHMKLSLHILIDQPSCFSDGIAVST